MTDLLTLPASDLVARIKTLEAEVEWRRRKFNDLAVACDAATRGEVEWRKRARANTDEVHNAALESAALLADSAGQHCLSAAIRGLRR